MKRTMYAALTGFCFTLVTACGLEDTSWCKGTIDENGACVMPDSTPDAGPAPDASVSSDADASTDPCSNRCGEGTICNRDTGDCVADVGTPDAGSDPCDGRCSNGTTCDAITGHCVNIIVTWCPDRDGDGKVNCESCVTQAEPSPGTEYRNRAVSTCDDNDVPVTERWYQDADGDTFPVSTVFKTAAEAGYIPKVVVNGVEKWDCDDRVGVGFSINPGNAADFCGDAVDNDCDGYVDENCSSTCTQQDWFRDADNDTYPVLSDKKTQCTKPDGYIPVRSDAKNETVECDGYANRNPGITEVPNDGVDNDCNASTPDSTSSTTETCYSDPDGDTYVVANAPTWTVNTGATCPPTFSKVPAGQAVDCVEGDSAVNPGRQEVPNNGKNDDCKDSTPDTTGSTETCYKDGDGDGVGRSSSENESVTAGTSCRTGFAKATNAGGVQDCNDGNAAIKPGATETCNGVDDDCDGQTDEDFRVGQACDGDYGICRVRGVYECNGTASFKCSANPGGSQTRAITEVPNNNADDDCDGQVDEGSSTPSPTTVTDGFRYTAPSSYVVLSATVSQCSDQNCTSFIGGILTGSVSNNTFLFTQVRNRGQGVRYYRVNVNLSTSAGGSNSSWSCLGANTVNGTFDQTGSIGAALTTPVGTVPNGGGGCEVVLKFQDN